MVAAEKGEESGKCMRQISVGDLVMCTSVCVCVCVHLLRSICWLSASGEDTLATGLGDRDGVAALSGARESLSCSFCSSISLLDGPGASSGSGELARI